MSMVPLLSHLVALLALQSTPVRVVQLPTVPVHVSVWYRGLPEGVPRLVDLEAIRAQGFTAVTWPLQQVEGALELRRMAATAGLAVVIKSEPEPATFDALTPVDGRVDISVTTTTPEQWTALVWRAVSVGARVVSFDPVGTDGVWGAPGMPSWVAIAGGVARQVGQHGTLLGTLSRGPDVTIEPAVASLEVRLLQNTRSWVIVATNRDTTLGAIADTYATFPQGVPAAEWLNLFDGSIIAMLYRPTGPRWHVRLGPGEARVFVIDKNRSR